MKNLNVRKWLLLVSLCALLLSGCSVTPPDVPACEPFIEHQSLDPISGHVLLKASPTCMKQIGERECGHCVFIMSGKEIFIGEDPKTWFKGKPWSQLRAESVLMPAEESYAPLAAFVINACKKMNCSADVTRFKVKLDSLNGLKGAIKN